MTTVVAWAALCLAQAPVPTPSPPTFRMDVEAVELDVSVTRGGKHVAGLTAADFRVLDSGVPQEVELAAAGDLPLTVILALDTSASMGRASHAPAFGGRRVPDGPAPRRPHGARELLAPGAGTGGLSNDLAAVRAQLERVTPDGMTALNDALYASLAVAEGAAGRCALVLFSDGLDNISWTSEADVLEAARASPAVVYVVASSLATLPEEDRRAVARDPREAFLEKLADVTGGQLVKANSDSALVEAFTRVLAEMRARYVLRFTPQGVPAAGWHPIGVKLKSRKGEVTTRSGYLKAASPH